MGHKATNGALSFELPLHHKFMFFVVSDNGSVTGGDALSQSKDDSQIPVAGDGNIDQILLLLNFTLQYSFYRN